MSHDESGKTPGDPAVEAAITNILEAIGEDPQREGLLKTPARVARSFQFLTSGMRQDPEAMLRGAIFDAEGCDEMVVVKDIELYSLCEHHLLPFHGRCHVGYIPDGKILGLSKVARLVDVYARRLQVQERLTQQVANTLQAVLQPRGVAVVVEAVHLCMAMRGVAKQNSSAVTSAMLGGFLQDRPTREEFLSLVGLTGVRR
ncbi:MAG: GTP cyclohydrolase I FolE [Acidobacteriota bacterium]